MRTIPPSSGDHPRAAVVLGAAPRGTGPQRPRLFANRSMDRRTLASGIALAAALLAGCRVDPAREMLERELRLQEDEIWRLEGVCDDYQQQLQDSQAENRRLRSRLGEPAEDDAPPRGARRRRPAADDDLPQPSIELPGEPDGPPAEVPPLRPPQIQPPDPGFPEGELPAGPDASDDELPPVQPVEPEELPAPVGAAASPAAPAVQRAPARISAAAGASDGALVQLELKTFLLASSQGDEHAGEEGLVLLVEPRDAAGQVVRATGRVSVVVLDPNHAGGPQRVERWDFAAAEAAAKFRESPLGTGLHLDLHWRSQPPANRTLWLYVRLITDDGQKLTARTSFDMGVPQQLPLQEPPPAGGVTETSDEAEAVSELPVGATQDAQPLTAYRDDSVQPASGSEPLAAEEEAEAGPEVPRPQWRAAR